MDEMSILTSEDEEMVKMKKREHLLNSVRKDKSRKSKRLENMLKNVAINSEDSLDFTPSHQSLDKVIPEKHPYNYEIPQHMNNSSYNYNIIPQNHPVNNYDFQPEATFSPHVNQPHPPTLNSQISQSFQNFDGQNKYPNCHYDTKNNLMSQSHQEINIGNVYPSSYNYPQQPQHIPTGYPSIPHPLGYNMQNKIGNQGINPIENSVNYGGHPSKYTTGEYTELNANLNCESPVQHPQQNSK